MDFSLTEDQVAFKAAAIEFARRELNEGAKQRERNREFNQAGWEKCAEFGIQGMTLPQFYGGLEMDILSSIAAMEGLGYACSDSGLLFSLNSHIWTCEMPILKFGSDEQKGKYLPGLANGSLKGGHAMTEPDFGSDAFGIKCKAVKNGKNYILNGTKTFITNAPMADILLVFAVTDATNKFAGLSVFLVEKTFPGFSVGKSEELMGLKTCPIGEVILQDCEVPEENRLGKEGSGAAIFNSEMEYERSCLFATHLGAMEKILEECIDYAKVREQFGKPIGSNQSISHKIADMKVRVELSRLILYKAAWMKSRARGHR